MIFDNNLTFFFYQFLPAFVQTAWVLANNNRVFPCGMSRFPYEVAYEWCAWGLVQCCIVPFIFSFNSHLFNEPCILLVPISIKTFCYVFYRTWIYTNRTWMIMDNIHLFRCNCFDWHDIQHLHNAKQKKNTQVIRKKNAFNRHCVCERRLRYVFLVWSENRNLSIQFKLDYSIQFRKMVWPKVLLLVKKHRAAENGNRVMASVYA